MTLENLLERKEYIVEQLNNGFMDDKMKSSLETMLDIGGHECIPDILEVMVHTLREAFKTKEGNLAFQDTASMIEDPSIRLDYKLSFFEMLFDDEMAKCVILLMLSAVDDTICIEDYLNIEDAE